MFIRRIFALILIILLVAGLLSIAGYAGWSQGYTMGHLAASGEGGTVAPYAPYPIGFSPFWFGIGLFVKLGLLLLLFLVLAKCFGFWAWRMAGGPPGKYWARHWPHHGPPRPPWHPGWEEEASAEQTEQTKPDENTGDVEPDSDRNA
jgi:hypothetical protein